MPLRSRSYGNNNQTKPVGNIPGQEHVGDQHNNNVNLDQRNSSCNIMHGNVNNIHNPTQQDMMNKMYLYHYNMRMYGYDMMKGMSNNCMPQMFGNQNFGNQFENTKNSTKTKKEKSKIYFFFIFF